MCVVCGGGAGWVCMCGHAFAVWAETEAESHSQAKDNVVCVCVCVCVRVHGQGYVCGVGRVRLGWVSVCGGGRWCVACLWHAQVVLRGWCVGPCVWGGVGV